VFHSVYRPIKRIIKKNTIIIEITETFRENKLATAGRMRVSSTSKIRKITAIRKNCTEKGNRADLIGSNPHSKGEGFSRSINSFLAKDIFTAMRVIEIAVIIGNIIII